MANTSIVTQNENVVVNTTGDLKNTFITIGDKTIPLATYEKTKLIIEEHLAFIDKIKNGFTDKTQKDKSIEERAIHVGEYVTKGSTYDLWVIPHIYKPSTWQCAELSIQDKNASLPFKSEINGCVNKLFDTSDASVPPRLSVNTFYWTNLGESVNSLGEVGLNDIDSYPYFLVKRIYKA